MPDDGRKTDLRDAMPSPHKFSHARFTATGEPRASVTLERLETLWINTGTLCNIECAHCYIESSPRNGRLAYITTAEVMPYLTETRRLNLGTTEIGFTGGEPFMNPHLIDMLDAVLTAGWRALVLTNAMKPMMHKRARLLDLRDRFGDALELRVSLDHFSARHHEEERGIGTFAIAMAGLKWLSDEGFKIAVAGRTRWGEPQETERAGYAEVFAREGIRIDADDPRQLVLFPEMDETADVPEITTACWGILGKRPADVMCASSRMIVKRKGASHPAVVACTLLPYDARFELGETLADADRTVPLNHPHCARFCVLGGASCSG